MDDSPRLIQNLRTDAQNREASGGFAGSGPHTAAVVAVVETPGSTRDHTQTTHAEGQKPHTATTSSTVQSEARVVQEQQLRSSIRSSALKVIVQSQAPAVPVGKEPGSSNSDKDGPGYSDDPVGRAQRRMTGLEKVRDQGKRIEVLTAIDEELAIEARATKSLVKLGRDFGKPEDRYWAGQWMHEHTVAEFVETWGVPSKTAYRWRHDYRRSRGLVK